MRYELSAAAWRRIAPLLPQSGRGGQWREHAQVVNGILWILHTGAPWRDLPARYGPWQTAYERFNRWRQDGTWKRLGEALLEDLSQAGELDWKVFFIDSTVVRASRAAAGAGRKGGRRSLRTMRSGARAAVSRPSSTSPATRRASSST